MAEKRRRKELIHEVKNLIDLIEKIKYTRKELLFRSFIQGLFSALGASIGLSIFLGFLTYFIGKLQLIPVISDIIIRLNIPNFINK